MPNMLQTQRNPQIRIRHRLKERYLVEGIGCLGFRLARDHGLACMQAHSVSHPFIPVRIAKP